MSIERRFFRAKKVQMDSLQAFGFVKTDRGYSYSEKLMEGQLEAQLLVTEKGEISGKVIDCDLGEEYLPLRQERQDGAFVGEVRQAYLDLLGRVAEACCLTLPFQSDQMNRMAQRIEERFGDLLDCPFEKQEDYQSYRVDGKWYGLIYPLELSKLKGISEDLKAETAEVINLKVEPKYLSGLLEREGIFEAYHMAKKSWVTVLLNDSLSDQELWELIAKSRQLAAPSKLSAGSGPDYWLIPANLKYYDIDSEFAASDTILWTQKASIKAGDFIFIYITAPTRAIRYACQVLEANIANQGYRDLSSIKTLMSLKCLKQFPDHLLTADLLKEYQVNAVRGPRRMSQQLIAFLKEKEYFNDKE